MHSWIARFMWMGTTLGLALILALGAGAWLMDQPDITQDPPRILRAGAVRREELEAVVGQLVAAP